MSKIKAVLFLVIGGMVALFFYENWGLPLPIKLFGKDLLTLPGSLIILVTFVIGFLFGWLGHVSWRRQRTRKAQAAAASREQQPPPQGEAEQAAQ